MVSRVAQRDFRRFSDSAVPVREKKENVSSSCAKYRSTRKKNTGDLARTNQQRQLQRTDRNEYYLLTNTPFDMISHRELTRKVGLADAISVLSLSNSVVSKCLLLFDQCRCDVSW